MRSPVASVFGMGWKSSWPSAAKNMPGEEAEPAVVKVKVGKHQKAFLAAFGNVRAPSARRAPDDTNGRLDRVDIGVDDGRVEATGDRPRSFGIAVELEEVRAGSSTDESAEPFGALDEAVRGLSGEDAAAQEPGLGLGEDEAEPASVMAAFEYARPAHVPAPPDPIATGDSLAVAAPALPERARSSGHEADAFVEGLVASGDPKAADAREEVASEVARRTSASVNPSRAATKT